MTMPAITHSEPDTWKLRFERDGETPEEEIVIGNGERALLHAVNLLIRRGELRFRDRLTVLAVGDDDLAVEVLSRGRAA